MKKLWLAACGLGMCGMLTALPVCALSEEGQNAANDVPKVTNSNGAKHENATDKRHREAVQQREALKAKRDAGMKVRAQHLANDDPGQAVVEQPKSR